MEGRREIIKCERKDSKCERKITSKIFNQAEIEYIKSHYKGTPFSELLNGLKEEFGKEFKLNQLLHFCYSHGFKNGVDTRLTGEEGKAHRFKKGNVPYTKGKHLEDFVKSPEAMERFKKSCFKKGHIPHNKVAVGTVVVDSFGYLRKKIAEPDKWERVHKLVWEEAHGKLEEGQKIIFLDGNKQNVSLDNLMAVSSEVNAKRMKFGQPANSEIGKTIAILSGLEVEIDKKNKSQKKK